MDHLPEVVLSIVVNPLNGALAPHKGQNLLTLQVGQPLVHELHLEAT